MTCRLLDAATALNDTKEQQCKVLSFSGVVFTCGVVFT
jgi:hypothetical protein